MPILKICLLCLTCLLIQKALVLRFWTERLTSLSFTGNAFTIFLKGVFQPVSELLKQAAILRLEKNMASLPQIFILKGGSRKVGSPYLA